jgi:hypothetical protein
MEMEAWQEEFMSRVETQDDRKARWVIVWTMRLYSGLPVLCDCVFT